MTRKDNDIDPALLPTQSNLYERVSLIATALIAIAGLIGYATVTLPEVTASGLGTSNDLALSVLTYGVGVGAFTLLFNYYLTPIVTKTRALKVASVYVALLVLLVPAVGAGAFHPQLAMMFLSVLGGGAVIHALFRQGGLRVFSNRHA